MLIDVGDPIVLEQSLDAEPRVGVVTEVLGPADRVHVRVTWDDGSESIFSPDDAGRTRWVRPVAQAQDAAVEGARSR